MLENRFALIDSLCQTYYEAHGTKAERKAIVDRVKSEIEATRADSLADMHTNRFGATPFTMNASVTKTFLDKTFTVKLSVTDIFNTSNNDWTMNTNGILVDKRQSYDQRGVSLSIIYTFRPRKSAYKGEAVAPEELKRL